MGFECIPEQETVLAAKDEAILVTARPGRGKTTLALRLADRAVRSGSLKSMQQVLFLSFSRNAVYQIEQACALRMPPDIRECVWIATYHSFMWWILRVFGRFHGLPRSLRVMGETKTRAAKAAAARAGFSGADVPRFLARTYGAISYDEFAPLTLDLLRKSNAVRGMIRSRFPVILVDEFQDTSPDQWQMVKLIANSCRLICFADPNQMIYGWRGASTARLRDLLRERQAKHLPLQQRCLRTEEHDLLDFAEAILDGNPGSAQERAFCRRRFLRGYPGGTALGYHLKRHAIPWFYSDFAKRHAAHEHPTIAFAAFTNANAGRILSALARPTAKAARTYRCSLLEGETDDALDELLVHLAAWSAGGSAQELEQALQLVGGMLTNGPHKASRPIASLFAPSGLLAGDVQPRGTAKRALEAFGELRYPAPATAAEEALERAVVAVRSLMTAVAAFARVVGEDELASRHRALSAVLGNAPPFLPLTSIGFLRDALARERLQRGVLERVLPVRGHVSSTLHKLKGREFDYVCVVTIAGDRLRGGNETEDDARRLLYVALTRARYHALVFYVQSQPCPLLLPYL